MGGLIGVFPFFFLQGVSSVFRGRRRWSEMKNGAVSGLGGRFQSGPPSFKNS
jgi:hypothetical protein